MQVYVQDDKLFFNILCERITSYPWLYDTYFLGAQCAAVSTKYLLMREPPHFQSMFPFS